MKGITREEFIKCEYDGFFAEVEKRDFTETKQITRFVKWCFDNHFLDGITRLDLNRFYEDDYICLPRMIHKGMEVYFVHYSCEGKPVCKFGIDPVNCCYGDYSDCSIAIQFPFSSKREELSFYELMNAILDTKTTTSKEWFNRKNKAWTGNYMSNMCPQRDN